MKVHNLINATTRSELRSWLEEHADTEEFCWVIISVKPEDGVIQYLDAVEEALCFGWIDSTKKKISTNELAQRLSPRKKNSKWTELNKARARRLCEMGLITDSGKRVLPDMTEDSFKIDEYILQRLKEDPQTYNNFIKFPKLYQVVRIDTIQSYKSNSELYNARLDKLIENTNANRMYGQWDDNGRLS